MGLCFFALAQRRTGGKALFSSCMAAELFSPNLTVAQALATSPHAFTAFVARRTACVGCSLARFCRLEDVATAYGIPLEELLGELRGAQQRNHPTLTGVENG